MATVQNDHAASRFKIYEGGAVAGFVQYRMDGAAFSLLRAEVNRGFEGRGLGTFLIRSVLADAHRRRLAVLPYCPIARSVISKHPQYIELVPADQRARFRLAAPSVSPA